MFFKLHGKSRTVGKTPEIALDQLEEGLQDNSKAYVYHCYNHYMCPIGFEVAPTKAWDAYSSRPEILEQDHWIIIGETSKCYPVFHVRKWEEIRMDIDNQNPQYYNIRKPQKGIMEYKSEKFRTGKKQGGNLHCIIEFSKQ